MPDRYDLVVLGGGTAALIASQGGAGVGARVAVIEQARFGGDCLWTGCVPSKRLIAAAKAVHDMRSADRHGLDPCQPEVDLGRVMAAVRATQAEIEPHDSPERLTEAGADTYVGRGRFLGPGRIGVGDDVLSYRTALIATGSSTAAPPIPGLGDAAALTTDTVWELTELPGRLVVLGGGPIGCELGQAFARLGSEVTIVEAMGTLLPRESADVGGSIADRLRKEGVGVRTDARATRVEPHGDGAGVVVLDGGGGGGEERLPYDRLLVAVGRRPASADLGLDTVGVETDEGGHVLVDDTLRTTGDHIFAAGDVTGAMPFTHVAAYQGRLAVMNALFRLRRTVSYDAVPYVTFTDPEVARVGLSAEAAEKRWGGRATVSRFDYGALDRALTSAEPDGFAELVADPKGRLVGATVIGTAAGESIAELTAWVASGAKATKLSETVHAYPTFAEGPSRAADAILRAKWFSPGMRRLLKPVLTALGLLDRARARGG